MLTARAAASTRRLHTVASVLVASGYGGHGEHGLGVDTVARAFARCELQATVGAVASGLHHTVAVSPDGEVYSWGRGDGGRLGNGTEFDAFFPTLAFATEDGAAVRQVACGAMHSLVALDDGQLFSWGFGNLGQLGAGDVEPSMRPRAVPFFDGSSPERRCARVAGGASHSAAVAEDGSLWTWGRVDNGRLGHGQRAVSAEEQMALAGTEQTARWALAGETMKEVPSPQRRRAPALHLPADFTPVLPGSAETAPRRVEALAGQRVRDVFLGGFQSFAVTEGGQLFGWGGNANGELGLCDEDLEAAKHVCHGCDVLLPVPLPWADGLSVTQVACGALHSYFLTDDGRVFASGDVGKGTLGGACAAGPGAQRDAVRRVAPPAALPAFEALRLEGDPVRRLVVGSFHAVALTASGAAYAWGDNGMGQLGAGATPLVGVPTLLEPRVLAQAALQAAATSTPDSSWLTRLLQAIVPAPADASAAAPPAPTGAARQRRDTEANWADVSRLLEAVARGDPAVRLRVTDAALGAVHSVLALSIDER